MLEFSREYLKLDCWNLVYTWAMSCCIVGIEIWVPCSYSSLYLSIFLSFMTKFGLCKLESSNMVYICRMSDCIMGIETQGLGSYFSVFNPFFFLSLYNMVTLKIYVGVFSRTFKARMVKLCTHMDNELLYCGIENRTPSSYSFLYLSIFLSF